MSLIGAAQKPRQNEDVQTEVALSNHHRRTPVQSATILAVTALLCTQFFIWKSHALRVSALMLKSMTSQLSLADELEWGSICNSLENASCARRVFGEVLGKYPTQKTALANLGIAEAKSRHWSVAIDLFDRYLAAGGLAYDVYFWKGRAHAEMGQNEKALAAYYTSLIQAPEDSPAGFALVDYLFSIERYEEALSVIGTLTGGHPAQSDQWRTKFADACEQLRRVEAKAPLMAKRALRLLSFGGHRAMLPVRFAPDAPFEYLVVNRDRAMPVIDENLLLQVPLKEKVMQNSNGATDALQLPQIQVGPWMLRDADFVKCQKCQSETGQSLLTQFDVREEMESGIQFLVLFPL